MNYIPFFKIFRVFKKFFSIVDLQCCTNFCCTADRLSQTYLYIPFFILSSITVYLKRLDIVPCAVQQDLISYPF